MSDMTTDHRGNEGSEIFPGASPETLLRIATAAQKRAEEAEAEGKEDGGAHLAGQSEYGCEWQWGDGSIPIDEDEPCARVYDCDGNTIEIIR